MVRACQQKRRDEGQMYRGQMQQAPQNFAGRGQGVNQVHKCREHYVAANVADSHVIPNLNYVAPQ